MNQTSILPNCDPSILAPMKGCWGILQVAWLELYGVHVLHYSNDAQSPTPIAMHHNGYACHELALRLIKGDMVKIGEQRDYMVACGSLVADMQRLENLHSDLFS